MQFNMCSDTYKSLFLDFKLAISDIIDELTFVRCDVSERPNQNEVVSEKSARFSQIRSSR